VRVCFSFRGWPSAAVCDIEENPMSRLALLLLALLPIQGAPTSPPPAAKQAAPASAPRRIVEMNVFHRLAPEVRCAEHEKGSTCLDASHWAIQLHSNLLTFENVGGELKELAALEQERDAQGALHSTIDAMVRADRTAPYGLVEKVVAACQAAGFRSIDVGLGGSELDFTKEIRIAIFWDAKRQSAIRHVGTHTVANDEELVRVLEEAQATFARNGKHDPTVRLDAVAEVPWSEIVSVVDLCRKRGLAKVEFATGR
jgi:biopolymer transport protein ExbD